MKLHPRAKDQHARFAERHCALLRDQIRRVEGPKIREEGLTVPFPLYWPKTVNGSTPYNAVYGRVPSLLPSIAKLIRRKRRLSPPQDRYAILIVFATLASRPWLKDQLALG